MIHLTEKAYHHMKILDEIFFRCSEDKSLTIQEAERLVQQEITVSRLAGNGECVSSGYGILQQLVSRVNAQNEEISKLESERHRMATSINTLESRNKELASIIRGLAEMVEDLYSTVPRIVVPNAHNISTPLDHYSIQNKISAARNLY